MDGESVGVEVVGDEIGARSSHVRRVGAESFSDLLQFGGELFLNHRFALLPFPRLVPDGTPPTALRPGGVHRDPAIHLDDWSVRGVGGRR